VRDFNRRFAKTLRKRKAKWEEHIVPLFRYLNIRVKTCKIEHLDTYEYLTIDSSRKLSKNRDLGEKIDSVSKDILEKIRSRRDEFEKRMYETHKKVEESKTKITLRGIEREKKTERFPPDEVQG